MTAYKNLGFDMANYPKAYAFFENEITLPLHTKLRDEEVDYIIETFKTVSEKVLTLSKKIVKKVLTKEKQSIKISSINQKK